MSVLTNAERVADLVDTLRLYNHKGTHSAALFNAVVDGPPVMDLTIDGASTLTFTVKDGDRKLLRSDLIGYRAWADVDFGDEPVRFELVAVSKTGDRLKLTFEDGIAAALRRIEKELSIPAGSTTRREIVIRLAKEARVRYTVDPAERPNVQSVVERSAHGEEKTNSWDVLGDLAEDIHWLVVGSDAWLFDRDQHPTQLREFTGPVHGIDFDLDVGKRASEATVTVDATLWALPPGSLCLMGDDMGPGEGKWLVAGFNRPLTSTRATVRLVRSRHVLKEPKRVGNGEPGDPGYVPGDPGSSGGVAGNAARERMVAFALSKVGGPYVWGGHGPVAYDCSGLVQAATAAGGRTLGAPSAAQWATCVATGKTVPIATALATRGGLLFRIGVGDYNHVAISLGNGSTVEARGSAYGIGVFGGAAGGGWTGGALWL
jgi:cell wall-associated NlpC family hydrolase